MLLATVPFDKVAHYIPEVVEGNSRHIWRVGVNLSEATGKVFVLQLKCWAGLTIPHHTKTKIGVLLKFIAPKG